MAASDPKLKWSGDAHDVRSDDSLKFETVYQEIWTVLIEASDHFSVALTAPPPLPADGDEAGFNPFLRVSNRRARRVSPIMAEVDVTFSGLSSGDGNDPTTDQAEVLVSHQDVEVGFDRDANGKKVCTITGEPYRGLVTVKADTVVTVTRALRRWNSARSVQFSNKVNASAFGREGEHPAGTVLCKGFESRDIYTKSGYSHSVVTGRFIAREPDDPGKPEQTWYKRVLRQGLYCFVVKNNQYKVVRCVDGLMSPATTPMLLDARGFQITPSETDGTFTEDTDVWDYIPEFAPVDFAEIGFFN